MKLGSVLQTLCKKQGMTLAELSRRSDVPKQTLHHWTVGRKSINPDQLRRVASCLHVSVHFLLYAEQDPFEQPADEILREIFSGDVRVTLHRIEKRKRST